jgi:hypothetical protein
VFRSTCHFKAVIDRLEAHHSIAAALARHLGSDLLDRHSRHQPAQSQFPDAVERYLASAAGSVCGRLWRFGGLYGDFAGS